jgi:NAD(P)-dependent dehydrogenase (short-subunit alcohol dehydrogenase family)
MRVRVPTWRSNYYPSEEPDAREVIQLLKDAGRKGLAIPGDIRAEAFCQRLVAETVQGLGGLDIVVCNAGRQQSKPSILDITTEDFDATMKTNIYAPFFAILDHQGRPPSPEAGLLHYRDYI